MECKNALSVIDDLFASASSDHAKSCNTKKFREEVTTYFQGLIQDTAFYQKIPILSTPLLASNVASNSLVRFRGVIQDIKNPEFFVSSYAITSSTGYESRANGMYRDNIESKTGCTYNLDGPNITTDERFPVYLPYMPLYYSYIIEVSAFFFSDNITIYTSSSLPKDC